MASVSQIRFGRLVESVASTLLPWSMAGDIRNVDISVSGHAKRRDGLVRAITSTDFGGPVRMIGRVVDEDGEEVYVVVGPDGIERI